VSEKRITYLLLTHVIGWRRGVVVSDVGLINAVNQRWARLVLEWVTVL